MLRWPVREGLLAYRARCRALEQRANELHLLAFKIDQLIYAQGGYRSHPKPPAPSTRFE